MIVLLSLLIGWTPGTGGTVERAGDADGSVTVTGAGLSMAASDLSAEAARFLDAGGLTVTYSGNDAPVTLRVKFTDAHGTVMGTSARLAPSANWAVVSVDFSKGVQLMGIPPDPDWKPLLVLYLDAESETTVRLKEVQPW